MSDTVSTTPAQTSETEQMSLLLLLLLLLCS
jgi:hypothetical protein